MSEQSESASAASARYWAVVPAAGTGSRMGGAVPKQYLELAGLPVLERTLQALLRRGELARIVVALAPHDTHFATLTSAGDARVATVEGGATRMQSVRRGLEALTDVAADSDWVLVHDAARPCVTPADIAALIEVLAGDDSGGILALPLRDTLKEVAADNTVTATLDRSRYYLAATPQLFRLRVLRDALDAAARDGIEVTDEAAAVERSGRPVRIVPGRGDNIKITRPGDLALAASILDAMTEQGDAVPDR